ncbi:MAG: hypothetical protein KJ558_10410 [Gammaproteobacteria bacterium]|nr:hypothetical protein [Gammaproteobacteria bacterium]MBU1655220.1 hypothetical protein [Gammaproteobacteria bacterium]MBU1961657.1 hypothetical protein [Gammaproteobacteria bacterium]
MSQETLHLVVPSLFSPPEGLHGQGTLRAPAVEKLLSWSGSSDGAREYEAQLFALMGLPVETAAAPYALLGEGIDPGEEIWMQADPVHMKVDLTRLILFEGRNLEIRQDEAEALAQAFNEHFRGEALEMIAPHPERWYLRLSRMPNLRTSPLSLAAGRSPDAFLPKGEDARYWQSLLTEAQMLFHASAVNKAREETGHPAINALWVHGPGRQAESLTPVAHFKMILADDPLALGLAQAAGAVRTELAKAIHADMLCVLHAFQHAELSADEQAWKEVLAEFDQWLGAIFRWLNEKRERTVVLYPCNGTSFCLEGRKRQRLWHRSLPFHRYLTPSLLQS